MTIEAIRKLEQTYKDQSYVLPNSHEAIEAYLSWHRTALLLFTDYIPNDDEDYLAFKNLKNNKNGYGLIDNFQGINSRYELLIHKVQKQLKASNEHISPKETNNMAVTEKQPLVFISHSSKDKPFVDELVDLLETIGLDSSNLFCSSIPGYWIGLSQDIFKELLNLFTDRKLYVIFIHSPRYYQSAVSLNEMGAAWVLKTDFCSFLTNDMEFSAMTGVINSSMIGIKCNTEEASYRLDEFKEQLISFLNLPKVDMPKWERKKKRFLEAVCTIKNPLPFNFAAKEDNLKARIQGRILSGEKGSRTLLITNNGETTAKNLRVEWLNKEESDEVFVLGDFTEIGNLTPFNERKYPIMLAVGHPELMKLRYHWEDEYSDSNSFEEDLQL